jgi:hypothetical protein
MMQKSKLPKIKKILVIVDTNRLGSYSNSHLCCKNYAYLEINKYLHENIVNNFNFKLAKNMLIEVAIPELALDELKQQQEKSFEEEYKRLQGIFKKFSKLPKTELKTSEIDYTDFLNGKISAYIGKYGLKIITYPKQPILPKLINKAIKRKKPFYKKDNEVDSGFKDSILWESILEFASGNRYDKYFFLTNDSDFEDASLRKEFSLITGKEISIVKEVSELKAKLEEEIKGTEVINRALESIQSRLMSILESIIEKNLLEISSGGYVHKVYSVAACRILDIDLFEKKYSISVSIDFEHESLYAIYAKHGVFDDNYIYDTDISPTEAILTFDEDYNLKEISSEEITFNGVNNLKFE